MIFFPPSKINLGLRIIEKRKDDFHNIDTVMFPIPLKDILEVIPSNSFRFTQSGLTILGKEKDNLCVKAYHLLKNKVNKSFPVHIHLHKQIPMGAGLGGGSSDASHILLALNKLWEANFNHIELENFAIELGSDCPFFIKSKAKYCTSKGEKMRAAEVNLSSYWIKLITPNIALNTAAAYKKIIPRPIQITTHEIVKTKVEYWKNRLINDFEIPVFNDYPILAKIKQELYKEGAVFASMSGSGSSLFGLFKEKPDCFTKKEMNEFSQNIYAL